MDMCVVCALVGLCKEASGSDPQNTEVSCVRAEGVCVSVCPTLTRHTSVTEAPSPYTHTNIHTHMYSTDTPHSAAQRHPKTAVRRGRAIVPVPATHRPLPTSRRHSSHQMEGRRPVTGQCDDPVGPRRRRRRRRGRCPTAHSRQRERRQRRRAAHTPHRAFPVSGLASAQLTAAQGRVTQRWAGRNTPPHDGGQAEAGDRARTRNCENKQLKRKSP